MRNEQLCFGLSQVLRKFPKETGKPQKERKKLNKVRKKKSSGSLSINCFILNVSFLHSDRVLCHFCFKPEKVTNEVLGVDYARKSQMLISSIILLKTALDALPLLSKVNMFACYDMPYDFSCTQVCLEVSLYFINRRCLRMQKVFFLQTFTSLYVKMRNMHPLERGMSQASCCYVLKLTGTTNFLF